ncbi:hypothetical protein F511_20138 [Dorcoceras hygrometricum]|uniref:Uncharacterized protein n=1 Tax=Dorcoceras hygrometricum TaxID=472368 RepID=A0A2Z7BXI8_9LAMI|nr:hypothetical protein F511_20138 [Dorcoceras hygrometricum]
MRVRYCRSPSHPAVSYSDVLTPSDTLTPLAPQNDIVSRPTQKHAKSPTTGFSSRCLLADFAKRLTRSSTSRAYVSYSTHNSDAYVIKSANRFTERSLNSNAYVIHTTTTHAADVMRSAARSHPKFENIEISRIVTVAISDPKIQPKHSK